ncbi:zinc finger protein RING-type protein [Fadolivirus algeromassiliense]|uniref:Zinc finger protein RING-type protein n=1 Tax=Fadolivirus FV1/VV64 TaxID=3070911 RepID=A0A7D3UUJ9_9VIRU|nr:zinc finger protein RING-type protein [Fadolivirus algeromassiliense]QKF94191.1 zinc finger protein RING-type protein [Fadolivirus FV1/VV64]
MPAGGLMQLVAYGAQDIYFSNTSNKSISYRSKLEKEKKKNNELSRLKNILKSMKFKNFRDHDRYNQTKCILCLAKFKAEEFVIVRKCKHIYHKECDHKSIIQCPICRQ